MPDNRTQDKLEKSDLFCADLSTTPNTHIGTILVTGASGYVGGRLVPELLARGYRVRMMVRSDRASYEGLFPGAEVFEADALNLDELVKALNEVDVAYYLIHSLHLGPKEFAVADMEAVRNFRKAAEQNQLSRIVYLGGLGDIRQPLSSHLRSRIGVANELKASKVPVTILRAGIIIGSGSASYELLLHIVKRLRVIPSPVWGKNHCQPISIRDVIKYLVGVIEVPETSDGNYSIGGRDVLTYEEMIRILADVLNRKVMVVHSPIKNTTLFGYLASLITPVPNAITKCLLEGVTSEVICLEDEISRTALNFEPLPYREAIVRALTREEQDQVATRWSDAFPPAHELAIKLHELNGETEYRSHSILTSSKSASALFRSVCRVGGKDGWFQGNWMWALRGAVDRLLTGVGTSRGRRTYGVLRVNDVIDFWRIEAIEPDRRLLLRAEMKLPGRAWLEFLIKDNSEKRVLSVTAFFDTNTISGRIYWYSFMPFHHFIFKHLIESIEDRARSSASSTRLL